MEFGRDGTGRHITQGGQHLKPHFDLIPCDPKLSEALTSLSDGSGAAGSTMGQCSRDTLPEKTGHTCSAQSVITVSTPRGSMLFTDFDI
jgi:hypothetical protein